MSFSIFNRGSLKNKLIINIILIHAVLMGLVVFDLTQREEEFIEKQLSQKGSELSSILASNSSIPLLNNDLVALGELLLGMNQIKDHYMIFILDNYGRVRASTTKTHFNKILDDDISKKLFNGILDNNLREYQLEHNNLIDTIHAITVNKRIIGYTRTIFDKSSLNNEIDAITMKGLIYIFLAIMLGAFFAWLAVRKITYRLTLVSAAAEKISNKEFNVDIPSSGSDDEFSQMIKAFNIMSQSIKGYVDELQDSKQKIEEGSLKLLEAQKIAHIGSWELDLGSGIMNWSPELFSMYKKNRDSYIPTLGDFVTHLSRVDKMKLENEITTILETGAKTAIEIKYNLEDGSFKYVHITGVPDFDDMGKPIKISGTTQDITKRVEDENKIKDRDKKLLIQSKLAQMGEMISMIAHQWRQPLAAIASTSVNLQMKIEMNSYELEQKESVVEFQRYYLEQLQNVDKYVKNLTETVDDFRNFYKPNKKIVSLTTKNVIAKSLAIIKASLLNQNIKIIEEYNSDILINLYDSELMQVILNILKNAEDNFLERKVENPSIKIETEAYNIFICDNGGGIEKEVLEQIFIPYFSTKNEKNGTGLGLHMSKIIIEEHHNGNINVYNTQDGVCFKITLGKIN